MYGFFLQQKADRVGCFFDVFQKAATQKKRRLRRAATVGPSARASENFPSTDGPAARASEIFSSTDGPVARASEMLHSIVM